MNPIRDRTQINRVVYRRCDWSMTGKRQGYGLVIMSESRSIHRCVRHGVPQKSHIYRKVPGYFTKS